MFLHAYESDVNAFREDRYRDFENKPSYEQKETYRHFLDMFNRLNWNGWVEAVSGLPEDVFQRVNYPLTEDDEYFPIWGTMFVAADGGVGEWLKNNINYVNYLGLYLYYITAEEAYAIGVNGAGFDFYEEYWSKLAVAYYYDWYEDDYDPENTYTEEE